MIIKISTSSLFKIVGIILGLWFIYLIRNILVIIFIAVLLAMAFDPLVTYFKKRKIPRPLGIIIIYVGIFTVLSLLIALIIPPLAEQIGQIASSFPSYWDQVTNYFSTLRDDPETSGLIANIKNSLESFETSFSQSATGIFSLIKNAFGSIISFILVFVLTFYFLVQEDAIKRGFRLVTPQKYQPYLTDLLTRMQERLVQWLRGELLLGGIIGFLVLIGLMLLGVKYYLVLALIAGFSELIPYVGPVLGAVPAVFLAFMESPIKGVMVVILYWLIQQMENHLIVPKVMQKAIGLNPIIVIIVILVGAKVAGFVGVLIAVPTTAILSVLVTDIFFGSRFKDLTKKEET